MENGAFVRYNIEQNVFMRKVGIVGMTTVNCPECNAEIDSEVSVCPYCGFPIKKKTTAQVDSSDLVEKITVAHPLDSEKQKKKKIIGITMCVVGVICLIFAVTKITDDDYKFYLEHYEDCKDGYEDCMDEAKYGGMFSGSYRSIASTYEDMMKDDMKEIWKYRGTAIVCCIAGIGLGLVGYKNIKKGGEA